MESILKLAATTTKKTTKRNATTGDFGVVRQIKIACKPHNRLATAIGAILGGFVPVATYTLAHGEATINPWYWLLVAGGLLYSATTVFQWGKMAFSSTAKALGFVMLVEGVMSFSHCVPLSAAALVILASINAINTGAKLTVK